MSDLTARIREAIGSGRPPALPAAPASSGDEVARALGGSIVECGSRRCIVIDREHHTVPRGVGAVVAPGFASPVAQGWSAACSALIRLLGANAPGHAALESLLFVDLETTGLAGGAGTHAFLFGCGWFEGATLRTRQFFLDRLGDEPALLDLAAERFRRAAIFASFNGKTFDFPLIETRYLFHRQTPPLSGKPHLDLLPLARRLWRGPDGCSLGTLEQRVFGIERLEDVPGFEIPSRYFAFLRGAPAATLAPIVAHNRADLVSLAGLALYIGGLIERGCAAGRTAEECFGLGRIFESMGESPRALECYERAVRLAWQTRSRRVDALRAMARLYRRGRRHVDASSAWEAIVRHGGEAPVLAEAVTALAIHHEHRVKDLARAKSFALQALDLEPPGRHDAVHKRLARLDREMERMWQPRFYELTV